MPVGSLKVGDNILDTYSYDIGIGMETLTFDRESFTLLNVVTLQKILGCKYSDYLYTCQHANLILLIAAIGRLTLISCFLLKKSGKEIYNRHGHTSL